MKAYVSDHVYIFYGNILLPRLKQVVYLTRQAMWRITLWAQRYLSWEILFISQHMTPGSFCILQQQNFQLLPRRIFLLIVQIRVRSFQTTHSSIPCQKVLCFCPTVIFLYLKLYNSQRCILRCISGKYLYIVQRFFRSAYIGLNTSWIKGITICQCILDSIALFFIKQIVIASKKSTQSNYLILTTRKRYFCTQLFTVVYLQSLYLCISSGYAKSRTAVY